MISFCVVIHGYFYEVIFIKGIRKAKKELVKVLKTVKPLVNKNNIN